MLVDLAFGRAYQIERLPFRIAHIFQNGFAGNAAIHHPYPARFAVGVLHLFEKAWQRGAIGCVALHHLISQRQPIGGHHQRNHQLQTIRSFIPTVTALGLRVLLHLSFEVRTGQIVEQHFEIRVEQVGPLLFQPDKQLLSVRQHPIQTSIEPSLAATAKSVSNSSSIAVSTYHCRCRRKSLPGSSRQFTTCNCSTFSQLTAARASGKRCCQNSSSPSSCHNSHPSQQAPKLRGRRNSSPLSFTCMLSSTSAGTSRSSGNRLMVR